MTSFHAVLIGEDGMEFGADYKATTKAEAWEKFRENYPESRVVQVESPEDTRDREMAMYAHISRGGDWDDDGRPIGGDYDDDDDEPHWSVEGYDSEEEYLEDNCLT